MKHEWRLQSFFICDSFPNSYIPFELPPSSGHGFLDHKYWALHSFKLILIEHKEEIFFLFSKVYPDAECFVFSNDQILMREIKTLAMIYCNKKSISKHESQLKSYNFISNKSFHDKKIEILHFIVFELFCCGKA